MKNTTHPAKNSLASNPLPVSYAVSKGVWNGLRSIHSRGRLLVTVRHLL